MNTTTCSSEAAEARRRALDLIAARRIGTAHPEPYAELIRETIVEIENGSLRLVAMLDALVLVGQAGLSAIATATSEQVGHDVGILDVMDALENAVDEIAKSSGAGSGPETA